MSLPKAKVHGSNNTVMNTLLSGSSPLMSSAQNVYSCISHALLNYCESVKWVAYLALDIMRS